MMWITRVIVRKRLFMVKTSLSPRLICTIARRRLPVGFLALFMLAPVFLRSAVIELSEQQAAAQTAATTFTFAAAGDLGASSAIASLSALDAFLACGADAWPADTNNDTFSDMFDIVSLTNHFSQAVGAPPNPPPRYDIAPNTPDGFVDIFDISKMTSRFGQRCQ